MYAKKHVEVDDVSADFSQKNRDAKVIDLRGHFGKNKEESAQSPVPAEEITRDQAWDRQRSIVSEMEELQRQNRWDDIIALCHPVQEKLPEIIAHQADVKIRSRLGFALGQTGRYDEAIAELEICVRTFPDNFQFRNTLAYNAYNSLYAARNRAVFLAGEARRERIALAHKHFRRAQELRPDGITNFYRQAMLCYRIENAPEKALPLFQRALKNWEELDAAQQQKRHQEKKNYIKSLYQASSALLKLNNAPKALEYLRKCEKLDHATDYVGKTFTYFAIGKVLYHLGEYEKARDALFFAMKVNAEKQKIRKEQPADFVMEMLGRTWLALHHPEQALEVISFIPVNRRRPYICWTQADALSALGQKGEARKVLSASLERDHLSRHKSLIRLAKLEYAQKNYPAAMDYAEKADRFFCKKWGNLYAEACYWRIKSAQGMGNGKKAAELKDLLKKHFPNHYRLKELNCQV